MIPLPTTTLNSNLETLTKTLGEPLKHTTSNNFQVYWYASSVPSKADLYYFQNDTLKKISLHSNDNFTLNDFQAEYGQPNTSVKRHQEAYDSQNLYVHVWNDLGVSIITQGVLPSSLVTRMDFFEPISQQQYFQTWGTKYATNPTVIPASSLEIPQSTLKSKPIIYAVGIFSIILVLILILFLAIKIKARLTKPHHQSANSPTAS